MARRFDHPPWRPRDASLLAVALVLAAMAWQERAPAQSGTWNAPAGSTGSWSTSSNWNGGTVANGSGNTATFTNNSSGTSTTVLDSDRTIGGITVSSTGLRLISGTGTTLTLATVSGTPTLSGTTNSTLAISATIAGSQGFRKTGAGALALAGATIFSGTAVLQTGTTVIQNPGALGATGVGNETVVLSGAQMRIATSGTIAESFVISGRGISNDSNGGGAIRAQGVTVTLSGGITVSGTAEIWSNSSTLTLAGNTSGTGGLIFRQSSNTDVTGNLAHNGWISRWTGGGGTLTLSGSNSYNGSTSIDNGAATLAGADALPTTSRLSVTAGGILDLNGNSITIPTFGWRDDGANALQIGNSSGGTITDNSAPGATTSITVTSGSFVLGTAITDGLNGRAVALRVAGADLSTIRLESPASTFSGGLTLLTGPGNGTRLRAETPLANSGSPGAITSSILGTGTVTVGLAPTDKAQFYLGPDTYLDGVGSTVLNDFVFNTAAGTDAPAGVLLNATETTFAGTIVADQASASFATGSLVQGSVAVLTGRVTSADSSAGLWLRGSGVTPGVTVRLANTGAANDYQGATIVEATTTLALGAADQIPNGVGKGNVSVAGTVNLGGFSDTLNGLTGSGIVEAGGGAPTLTVGAGDATASFAGVIGNTAGTLAFVKIGSGVQALTGANNYSGPTAVSGGVLSVNGDQSGASGAVTVDGGATLAGTGTVGGVVTVNGILSPGNSPGVLTVPTLLLGGSSTSLFEINGTTRGTLYDGMNITSTGGLAYGGVLSLSFGNGSAFADATAFDLFSFTGTPSGNFSGVTSTGFYTGTWTLTSGIWSLDSEGQTLSFTPSTGDLIVAVPEPSMLVLLAGLAVTGLIVRRRSNSPRAWRVGPLTVLMIVALQASPGRVFAQTNGTWNSAGTTSWNNAARWSGGVVAGGTGATATFTASGTAALFDNIVLGNLTTTVATSARIRINSGSTAATPEQIEFVTTTGTAPRITNTNRVDMYAIVAGTQGLTKSGTGILYLWRPNTYTGVTTISTAQIYLRDASGLGATGAGNGTVVQSGATLRIDTTMTTAPEPLTISGSGVSNLGVLRPNTVGTVGDYTGPITLNADSYITAAPDTSLTLSGAVSLGSNSLTLGDSGGMTISGAIDGTGNVSYGGTGIFVLSGSNTFSGTTTVTNAGGAVAMNGYLTGPMNFAGVSGRNLIGTGTFGGGATVGANTVLAPGAAAAVDYGTLTASRLEVQSATVLLGIQDASTYDRLVMTAPAAGLTLGGTASLVLDFAGELSPTALNLLTFTGLSGNFEGVTSTGFYAGTWIGEGDVWTLDNVGTGGAQSLSFNEATGVLAVVPEPSALVLFGGIVAAASLIRRRRRPVAHLAMFLAVAGMLWPLPALAQSGTWTAAAGSTGLWSGTANWSGGIVADGSGNTATFTNNSGTSTTTLDTNRTLGSIVVSGTGTRAIDGPAFTLTLATATGTPTLSGTNNSALGITAVVAGTQGFRKTGTSTLALLGANTFSGTATLQTGTTVIQNLGALGATGVGNETVVASGAQLRITGGLSGVIAESFALSGRGNPSNLPLGGGGAIRVQGSAVTIAGDITISGTSAELFPDNSSSLTVAGNVSGTGGFILRNTVTVSGNMSHNGWINRWSGGTGMLTLSGSNSYTGATGIDNGPAQLNNAHALPAATALSVTGASGLLDLNGYDTTIRTFGWREDGVNPPAQNTSSAGIITDNSTAPGTTSITVTSGSFALGTAINDGSSGRRVALRVAAGGGVNLANIELNNAASTFSGGLTLLNGADRGTRLDIRSPLANAGSPGAITSSILGTGTVTVGLAPTDKAQFYLGPGTYTESVGGSTVLNDLVFNTAAGTDAPAGVLLDTTEATFAGNIVADQASASFATGSIVPSSMAVLSGRVTSTGSAGGLWLRDTGVAPGVTVRLANATGTANDYQGPTAVEANTTLALGAADQVPNGVGKGNVSVAGSFNLGGLSDTINGLTGSGIVEGGGLEPILTVGDGDATASFGGVIRNSAGVLSLVKIGSGVQALGGVNTYAGPTTVSAGTLLVNGDQSAATGPVAVASGATLGGAGTVGGATTIESGATLAPGASPGTLTFAQGLTLAAGGNYNWQILNAGGTAGATDGWDLVSVGGVLDVASTSADPFKINLWSLSSTAPDVNGNALNFDASQGSTWKIASASGGITGFDADKFQVITGATNGTGGFANPFTGTFSLALSGSTDLNLVYTAGTPTVITINVASGTETQAEAGHPLLAGTTPVEKIGLGTVVFDQANTLTGPTTVTEGTLELATADALSSSAVTVAAGATLAIGPQVSAAVPSLTNDGLVDVGLGELTVVSGLTAEGLKSQIVAGRNEGAWDGATGITSSGAAGTADRAVGWIDNGDGSLRFGFAAAGDLDMNGLVDLDDVIAFVSGGLYDTGAPAVWAQGDYDYNGIVDLDDVIAFVGGGLYDQGPYNQPVGGLSLMGFGGGDDPGLMSGGFTAVPEPGTWVLAGSACGFAGLLMRRRRAYRA